jgi:S1-C subfamily serine protease
MAEAQHSDKRMPWHTIVEIVAPQIVRISTPRNYGTGFLLGRSPHGKFTGIATAAHVINEAHMWHEPIRIEHVTSGKEVFLEHNKRGIRVDQNTDAAAIAFDSSLLNTLPEKPIALFPKGRFFKIGNEIAWLGFPVNGLGKLCFFAGRVSSLLEKEQAYLLDGVIINGVSGGPVIASYFDGSFNFFGVVSAYRPNMNSGSALPGLGVATSAANFHAALEEIKALKDFETPPAPVVPPPTVPTAPAAIPPAQPTTEATKA